MPISDRPGVSPALEFVCEKCGKTLRLEMQGRTEAEIEERARTRGWSIASDKCYCRDHLPA